MNAIEWYNYIAKRNGGYKYNVPFEVMGLSAETVFEQELIQIIKNKRVLDAGCGHGEFTLSMAQYAEYIIGFDFAEELIKIALRLKKEKNINNADFVSTKYRQILPFPDESFDVIYSRRGPVFVYEQGRLLKKNGVIIGIHAYPLPDRDLRGLLETFGIYKDITITPYQNAVTFFNNESDFAEYLSSSNLNPDYTLEENKEAFQKILENSYIEGKIGLRESKQIWRAVKA